METIKWSIEKPSKYFDEELKVSKKMPLGKIVFRRFLNLTENLNQPDNKDKNMCMDFFRMATHARDSQEQIENLTQENLQDLLKIYQDKLNHAKEFKEDRMGYLIDLIRDIIKGNDVEIDMNNKIYNLQERLGVKVEETKDDKAGDE